MSFFQAQKRFVAKQLAAVTLRPPHHKFSSEAERSSHLAVAQRLTAAFTDIPPSHPNLVDEGTLQELLVDQLAFVKQQVFAAHDQQAFQYYVQALTDQVEPIKCAACPHEGTPICKESTDGQNNLNLRAKGLCVAQINSQFAYLRQHVEAMIVQYAHRGDASSLADLSIELSRTFPSLPYPGERPKDQVHFVKGRTRHDDEPGRRWSEVILESDARFFDWPSLLCVTWLFAHELICHAFQGRAGKRRDPCDEHCPFYEGWMDEVAFALLRHFLLPIAASPTTAAAPSFLVEHGQDVLDQATIFRKARYGRHGSPESQWELGMYTARRLLNFFIGARPSTEALDSYMHGLAQLIGLSYRIQHCDPVSTDLASAVSHVYTLLMHFDKANKSQDDTKKYQLRIALDEIFNRPFTDFPLWVEALGALNASLTRQR
jgi:hypothetical protein